MAFNDPETSKILDFCDGREHACISDLVDTFDALDLDRAKDLIMHLADNSNLIEIVDICFKKK